MFGLDWWILLACTILFNIIWPPITLAITLWWGIKSTNKTLHYAQSIERKVSKAISDMEKDAKQEDLIAALLDEQAKSLKAMMDGFRGDILKQTNEKIDQAKAQVKLEATSQMSKSDRLLELGMNAVAAAIQPAE